MKLILRLGFVLLLLGAGSNAWSTSIRFTKIGVPIVVGEKLVFAGPGWESHRLICIDKKDGQKLWELTATNALSPCFSDDAEVIATAGSDIERIDPVDGSRTVLLRTSYQRLRLQRQPDGAVYAGNWTPKGAQLIRLNPQGWTKMWETPAAEHILADGSSVLLCEWSSTKAMGDGSAQLVAKGFGGVDKASGKWLWRLTTPLATPVYGAAVSNGFVITMRADLLWVQAATGRIARRSTLGADRFAAPLVRLRGGVIAWVTKGSRALEGEILAIVPETLATIPRFPTTITASSVEVVDDVIIGRNIGRIAAYSLEDGRPLWEGGQWSWAGVHDGDIFFSRQDDKQEAQTTTSINRINLKTEAVRKLYEERIPSQ